MTGPRLSGKKIAFLATDGFEQVELTKPWEAISAEGAEVELISLQTGKIQGMNHDEKADTFEVDGTVDNVNASDYAGLVLPGGLLNPDTLRTNERAVEFVREFFQQSKPVAAICHGPWMLVEAGVVKDRKRTSWPSLRTDIENAGGQWHNEEVVVDSGLVTSRKPDDLEVFCKKAVEEFCEGQHEQQVA